LTLTHRNIEQNAAITVGAFQIKSSASQSTGCGADLETRFGSSNETVGFKSPYKQPASRLKAGVLMSTLFIGQEEARKAFRHAGGFSLKTVNY
jgi:hypothetical protein